MTSKNKKKGAVGRSDLLELVSLFPKASYKELAELLGYSYEEDLCEGKGDIASAEIAVSSVPVVPSKMDSDILEDKMIADQAGGVFADFWHVESREIFADEPQKESAAYEAQSVVSDPFENVAIKPSQEAPYLMPWARLWPFLKGALRSSRRSRLIDEKMAVKCLSRALPVDRIPMKPCHTWAEQIQLIVDYDERLFPFWNDFNGAVKGISKVAGEGRLDVYRISNGPMSEAEVFRSPCRELFHPKSSSVPLLIFSDLGCYDKSGKALDEWIEFGQWLKNLDVCPVVLMPVSPDQCDEKLSDYYRLAFWDKNESLPVIKGEKGRGKRVTPRQSIAEDVELLLSLLSPATRVEPKLMRAMRFDMRVGTVAVEANVWLHERVNRHLLAFEFDKVQQDVWREKFMMLDADRRQLAIELIQKYHSFLPEEIQLEEEVTCGFMSGKGLSPAAIQYLEWLGECFADGGGEYDSEDLCKWVNRMSMRQFSLLAKNEEFSNLHRVFAYANNEALEAGESVLFPEWFDPNKVPDLTDSWPDEIWLFVQEGESLKAIPEQEHSQLKRGCPIASIRVNPTLTIEEQGERRRFSMPRNFIFSLSAKQSLVLRSESEKVELSIIKIPEWADSIWQDQEGLHVTLPLNDSKIKWVLPSEVDQLGSIPDHVQQPKDGIEYGFWLNRSQLEKTIEVGIPDTSWANVHGFDQYGFYADFSIEGVVQRMRWIQPGTFMMGSPEDELARQHSYERQREVTLSEGYWLADTVCTQKMWIKVMDGNPSYFKEGGELPVENVSWDDCQDFFRIVNDKFQGPKLRLPTEAEWEYACRAGTNTPFAFGKDITTEQVNYNGNYPYNGGAQGEYREKTVSVKGLPCNQWGLYQMHGNVREWCAEYLEGPIKDPQGPAKGVNRVLRGGSWNDRSWHVHSANRGMSEPSNRGDLGFRFSLDLKG
ncbi:formylglycine-generating enzyme family protein [Maridesulfovibrio sp. FT414]|uniref:formylglycine-generating enzyme family protein n=1 Tax=Maridesulfovibrio sp. FT414 TaxID=2979469 RepID=UPI003D805691